MPTHQNLNIHYDAASKTALLQCGKHSEVLRNLPNRQMAETAARLFASRNWGYKERGPEKQADALHPAANA